MRLVLVEWLDSHVAIGGWKELDAFCPEAPVVRSVGWLLRDGPKTKVIVPHMIHEQAPFIPLQGCGEMAIPEAAIVSMTELQAPEAPGGPRSANVCHVHRPRTRRSDPLAPTRR